MSAIHTVLMILCILSLIIATILRYKISRTIGSKGYRTSFWSKPSQILDFIRVIRNENDKREKKDYKIILIAYFSFYVLTILLFFLNFYILLKFE